VQQIPKLDCLESLPFSDKTEMFGIQIALGNLSMVHTIYNHNFKSKLPLTFNKGKKKRKHAKIW